VTPEAQSLARSLMAKVAEAAEKLGISREELDALQRMVGKPTRLAYGESVFEIGEPWDGIDGAMFALDFFEGEGDNRLGRYRDGDARVYLVAIAEARDHFAQAGASSYLVITLGETRSTRRFYDEQTFVDMLAREWVAISHALKAPFLDDEDEQDTECECGAETRVWEPDDEGELVQADGAKFCGSCGRQIPIVAEVMS
jgi:hypothetical protein